jgi:hypothetical protein
MQAPPGDPEVEELARLFREHPAWRAAARYVSDPDATSDVYFTRRPGEAWHLELARDGARLLPGRSEDPDFVFRFPPEAVRRLADVEGDVADFAIALFEGIDSDDPDARIDLRIAASFPRLLRRGYVKLILAAGPRLLALGAARGWRGLSGLRRLVESARRTRPEDWELGPE